jgi:hypothetical protein
MTDSGESFGTELKRAVCIKTTRGSRIREEIGNYRIEEHSRELFGSRRFAVWRVGKKQRDGSTKLHRVGWYQTYRGAMEALSLDRQKREGACPWPGITQDSEY